MYVLLIFVLFHNSPVIVASVSGVLEELDPAGRVVVDPRRQDPLLEERLLLFAVVAVHLQKGAPAAQPLDLPQGLQGPGARQVVNGIDRQHAIEGAVWKGKLLGAAEVEAADDFRLAMRERIQRDIQTEYLQPRA